MGRIDMRQYHTNLSGLHNFDGNIKGLLRDDASLRARESIDIFLNEERIY